MNFFFDCGEQYMRDFALEIGNSICVKMRDCGEGG